MTPTSFRDLKSAIETIEIKTVTENRNKWEADRKELEAEIVELKARNEKLAHALESVFSYCNPREENGPMAGWRARHIRIISHSAIEKEMESRRAKPNSETNRPQIVPNFKKSGKPAARLAS